MSQLVEFIVLGLPQSGKTTFIKSISRDIQWQEDQTNNWLFGLLPVDDNLKIQFMEPPATPEFDFMWTREVIADTEADGFIVTMNAADTHSFGAAVYVLQTIRAYHPESPIVIAANFQDVQGAWSADDIRMGLQIPDDMPVLNCVAFQPGSVKQPVLELLYKVLGAAS
jgi:uncharacterized protein